jgi:hypothetical protein
MITKERSPASERSMTGDGSTTMPWSLARERLANPEVPRTCWLATARPDGRPHLVPVIGFWVDGAMHVVAGETTRKARNLAADGRCVIATTSTTLPSIDLIVEGHAVALTDGDEVGRIADLLRANNWPLVVEGARVIGPHAPTAGPPPYTIYRIVPTTVFGLPGMVGMDQFDPSELPKPTRWEFGKVE